jgi:hypothetical protein
MRVLGRNEYSDCHQGGVCDAAGVDIKDVKELVNLRPVIRGDPSSLLERESTMQIQRRKFHDSNDRHIYSA